MAVLYSGEIEIRKIVTGPYENNAYLVVCPQTRESVMIDAPAEPDKILAQAKGTKVKAVLFTHTHADHTGGFKELKAGTGAPMIVHPDDASGLPEPPDGYLEDNGTFSFGSITFKTIHVPGHTPGGISFLWGKHLFSGDTLFPGGPGHTTSPANLQRLLSGLEEKILILPDDVNVYPGHGDETVLGKEKRRYQAFKRRSHPPDLCGQVTWDS